MKINCISNMSKIDKVLVFDIWGDYAHFKKIETTTSPLTYSIPTGTSLAGLIAAILGFERDSYYDFFSADNCKLAIKIINPIKKIRININLIKTDDCFYLWDVRKSGNPRSPTPFEFLKEPKYRIYFWLKDKGIRNKLKTLLKVHKCFYTPYLGISEMIANFNFVGEFSVRKERKQEGYIESVLRKGRGNFCVEQKNEDKIYSRERIPVFMNRERVVQDYADVFFEMNAKKIKVKNTICYRIGKEYVVFL